MSMYIEDDITEGYKRDQRYNSTKSNLNQEKEVKITLVSKELINEDTDMFRISCDGLKCGWGSTLEIAIKDFDEQNR